MIMIKPFDGCGDLGQEIWIHCGKFCAFGNGACFLNYYFVTCNLECISIFSHVPIV